jgi:hypothetical protein
MGEHKIPRETYPGAPAPDETFWFREGELGKSFSVRDATTEMLERHAKMVTELHIQETQKTLQAVAGMIGNLVKLASMKAVMEFELDRRRRKGGLVAPDGRALQ